MREERKKGEEERAKEKGREGKEDGERIMVERAVRTRGRKEEAEK